MPESAIKALASNRPMSFAKKLKLIANWLRAPADFCRVLAGTGIVLSALLMVSSASLAQPAGSLLYFANEEFRLAKVIERKEILDYRVVAAGERRYRETFFDSADLYLFERRMFYRVKDGFDGKARVEFYAGHSANKDSAANIVHSAALPARTVLAVGNGQLDDPALSSGLPVPTTREFKNILLTAEYAKHSVTLERRGKAEFLVSLLAGTFVGVSGKKIQIGFLALEIQPIARRVTAAHFGEIKRIADSLSAEVRLAPDPMTLYSRGIEKAVLLRPDERRLQPLRVVGGARGSGFDQFDQPDAVAFTLDGRLVAGDTDNARFKIYSFGEQTQSVQIIGAEGTAAGEFGHGLAATLGSFKIFHQVQGIAVDSNGLIYVIDQGNQRIQLFDGAGKVQPEKNIPFRFCTKEAPRCADGLWRPSNKIEYNGIQGIAIDADGGVYISDKGTSRVYRLLPGGKRDPNFNLQEVEPASGEPMLKEPESLVLHQNKLFVSNEGSGEIKMFDRRTGRAIRPGAGFGAQVFSGKAEGLAVTGDYLFAVDVQNTRIAVFDLTGENPKYLLGFVGDFQSADGIAIDPTGKYVAIADQGNLRVLLYSLPEMLRHLAGLKR